MSIMCCTDWPRLLEALIARCETGPWRQMLAVIGDGGNSGSIKLYRRLGFRQVGTFKFVGFKRGQRVDTVLMQRGLATTVRRSRESGQSWPQTSHIP